MKIADNSEDFENGFENGLENIEKANYEGVLSSEVSLDWLQESKEDVKAKIDQLNTQIAETKNEKLGIYEVQKDLKVKFEEQDYLVNHLETKNDKDKGLLAFLQSQKTEKSTSYPFLAGILYLVAGITFVAGDLIISHEIVAYALNIRNTFEAWAFACGLAGVSVLLKPAYERLIEQPYLTQYSAKTKRIYGYFQLVLVIISLGTLSVLGWFRYESYKTDRLKQSLNQEIKALQQDASSVILNGATVDNPVLNAQIAEKLKEYAALNQKLVDSPWALWSFVLSGVLFAIAGAICLGIAFPILQVFWKRWFYFWPKTWGANRRIRKREKQLIQIKKPWIEAKAALEHTEQKLSLLASLAELETEKKHLEQEYTELNEKIKLAIESARVSHYNVGYESGLSNRNLMTDAEFEEYRKKNFSNLRNQKLENEDKSTKSYRTNGLRPHQALRKAITEQFGEN